MSSQLPILIVDDEPQHSRYVARVLSNAGYAVVVAEDIPHALDLISNQKLRLIITDVMMPVMTGFALCQRVKGDPKTASTPVIILSGLGQVEDLVLGLGAGADSFLTKPIEEGALRAQVEALLRFENAVRTDAAQPDVAALLRHKIVEMAERASLTPREREILDLLLMGRTIGDIATAMGIAERTVKFHQARMLDKVGADSRMDLFRLLL